MDINIHAILDAIEKKYLELLKNEAYQAGKRRFMVSTLF